MTQAEAHCPSLATLVVRWKFQTMWAMTNPAARLPPDGIEHDRRLAVEQGEQVGGQAVDEGEEALAFVGFEVARRLDDQAALIDGVLVGHRLGWRSRGEEGRRREGAQGGVHQRASAFRNALRA